MFYRCKKSHRRILHAPGCYHLAGTAPEDLIGVKSVSAAFNEGYRMCSCCNPLSKMLKAEEKDILPFCLHNGLSYELHNKSIAVITPRSQWKIALADNKPKTMLYHRNDDNVPSGNSGFLSGHHIQNVCYYNLFPYFEYILHHDTYRVRNPFYVEQKREPPRKGTKRYRKKMAMEKRRARAQSVRNVLNLIESLPQDQEKQILA